MFAPGIVIYLHDVTLFVLVIAGLLRKGSVNFLETRLAKYIFAFLFIAGLSLLLNSFSYKPLEILFSSMYLIRWMLYGLLYFIVAKGVLDTRTWLRGLLFSGFAVAVLGLIQYVLYPTLRNLYYLGWDEHYYRLFSTFLDPNFVGLYISFAIFLCLYGLVRHKGKMLWVLVLSILSGALLLTYSRSSFVSFLAGSSTLIVLLKKFKQGFAVLTIFILIIFILPNRGRDILRLTRSESALARIGNWKVSFDLFLEKPMFGHGFNTIRFLQMQRGWMSDTPFVSRSAGGLDNSFLFIAVTTGIMGLASYLMILGAMMRMGIELQRVKGGSHLGALYLSTLVAMSIHSLFVNSLFYPWILLWVWVFTGVVENKIISDRQPGAVAKSYFQPGQLLLR